VDFQLTADEAEFRGATRKLCAGRMPISRLRELEGHGLDRGIWGDLADFGVFTLRTGAGLGAREAALVFEELGRGLVPGPLAWTYLADGLGLGDIVGGVERGAGPLLVEHLDSLDALLVLDGDDVYACSGVIGTPVAKPLDPLTPVWVVDALPLGEKISSDAARWRLEGAALVAAQLAGMAEALTELTVAYTAERRQFGRPVGSFQALKHMMADMLVRSELARTQAYAAAVHLDDPSLGGTERAVSSAKSVAGRAAVANGQASIQAHGGMGCTWEVDSHLYLKRAWVLDSQFGSADDHADAVAASLT
jgi:alkylation response protein AidB-like acyl-CoA dehydrogenase